MLSASYRRRALVALPAMWCFLATGMYLWSIRSALGLRNLSGKFIELPIATGDTSSGLLFVSCSVQVPLRPNHTYGLNCLSTPLETFTLKSPVDLGLNASGSGFLVSPTDERVGIGSNGARRDRFAPFQITPIASGSQDLVITASAAGTARSAQWFLDVELKPVEIILISAFLALPLGMLYSTIWDKVNTRNRVPVFTPARIEKAESKVEQAPEKVNFPWELTTGSLEACFDRNVWQVGPVFWLVVVVTEFVLVLCGIIALLSQV